MISFWSYLWTYLFSFIQLPLLGMWRWLTTWSDLIPLCNLWIIPGSSPINDLLCSYFISTGRYVFHFIHDLSTPYSMIEAICSFIVMSHAGLTSLISILCIPLYFSLMYHIIIDWWYIYVNPYLVLKFTKTTKELYLSSLVISPRKEW